jgi:hypothetical protein
MHSGFEAGIIQHAFTSPGEFGSLVRGFLRQRSAKKPLPASAPAAAD